VRRSLFLDSHKQDRFAAIAADGFEVRSDDARNMLQALLHVAFGVGKRIPFPGGEHTLDSSG
jgi:hypothetical protein